jgi:hypothetical protein
MDTIKTDLVMRSTAQLNEEVLEELQIPDPGVEAIEAALKVKHEDEEDEDESEEL